MPFEYSKHKPGGSDDLYLKLRDGDTVRMRIYSDPAIVLFKEGQKPRYAWVVINHDKKKAQVFNAGVSIYSQIADLTEDWGAATEFSIIVRRKGSGQFDTEYSVTPMKTPVAPSKAEEDEAAKIDLLNATKGKWLADYIYDGVLPPPVTDGGNVPDEVAPMPDDTDAPIELSDIPF